MDERCVGGAPDHVWWELDPARRRQRLPDVDLGQHAKTLLAAAASVPVIASEYGASTAMPMRRFEPLRLQGYLLEQVRWDGAEPVC